MPHSVLEFEDIAFAKFAIMQYLAAVDPYAGKPLGEIWKVVSTICEEGTFVCVGTSAGISGLAGWFLVDSASAALATAGGGVDLRHLSRKNEADAILVLMHARTTANLKEVIASTKSRLVGRVVSWDRHKGKSYALSL